MNALDRIRLSIESEHIVAAAIQLATENVELARYRRLWRELKKPHKEEQDMICLTGGERDDKALCELCIEYRDTHLDGYHATQKRRAKAMAKLMRHYRKATKGLEQ